MKRLWGQFRLDGLRIPICKWINDVVVGLGLNDRRRVIHSLKAGLALGVVSCSVLLQEIYQRLGKNVVWAVLTVVVVFECTVGATLSKGLNRGVGTVLAAALALFFDHVANKSGLGVEPIIVGGSVFVIGVLTTYTRFFPQIKAKYDYGIVMFLLTFCLVVVSGYRAPDNIDLVFDRMLTIILGGLVCVLVSVCIFPVWAGDDLHNLLVNNFDDLAESLEGCIEEYFFGVQNEAARRTSKIAKCAPYNEPVYKGYRAVLISKQTEESLANFATWEPWHGRFGCRYPWEKCIEVGAILRHCAYTICALHGYVLSDIQAPDSLRRSFSQPCMKISTEIVQILKEIADSLKECSKTSRSKECMLNSLHRAVDQLYECPSFDHYDGGRRRELSMRVASSIHTAPVQVVAVVEDQPVLQNAAVLNGIPSLRRQHEVSVLMPSISRFAPLPPKPQDEISVDLSTDGNPSQAPGLRSHKCREFAESLSVTTVASLLIELVSRMEPLLKAVAELEEAAGFKDQVPLKLTRRHNLKRYNTEKLMLEHLNSHLNPL